MKASLLTSRNVPAELHGEGRFVLPRRDFVPAYVKTNEKGRLEEKVEAALKLLHACKACPRACGANRWDNQTGVCQVGRRARVSSAFAHLGEEDCLRGWRGSGTIFFSSCNLRCVFCQNSEISQLGEGHDVTAQQLAAIMLRLQEAGCHNINLVTPTHVVPQILEALLVAVEGGLRLPLVYNTGAYDSLESIQLLDRVVDIYMPDFKLWDAQRSAKYLTARDYPEAARRAIKVMHEQVGALLADEDGLALRGVLVRHLVMPGMLDDTREIVRWLAANLSPDTYVNVMDQYHPAHKAETEAQYSEINRRITRREFERAIEMAREAGLWRFDGRRLWFRRIFYLGSTCYVIVLGSYEGIFATSVCLRSAGRAGGKFSAGLRQVRRVDRHAVRVRSLPAFSAGRRPQIQGPALSGGQALSGQHRRDLHPERIPRNGAH
jgi:putative pyruvate formate lyase activating enzyme